jgi:hypothetical protein
MLFASNAADYEKDGKKGVKRMNQTSDANVKEHRTQAKRCFKTHHLYKVLSRIGKATRLQEEFVLVCQVSVTGLVF